MKYNSSTKNHCSKAWLLFFYLVVEPQLKKMLVKLDHLPQFVWDEEFQKIFENHLEPHFRHSTFVGYGSLCRLSAITQDTGPSTRSPAWIQQPAWLFGCFATKNLSHSTWQPEKHSWQPMKDRKKKHQSLNNWDDIESCKEMVWNYCIVIATQVLCCGFKKGEIAGIHKETYWDP